MVAVYSQLIFFIETKMQEVIHRLGENGINKYSCRYRPVKPVNKHEIDFSLNIGCDRIICITSSELEQMCEFICNTLNIKVSYVVLTRSWCFVETLGQIHSRPDFCRLLIHKRYTEKCAWRLEVKGLDSRRVLIDVIEDIQRNPNLHRNQEVPKLQAPKNLLEFIFSHRL
jgi:hypothetical protein